MRLMNEITINAILISFYFLLTSFSGTVAAKNGIKNNNIQYHHVESDDKKKPSRSQERLTEEDNTMDYPNKNQLVPPRDSNEGEYRYIVKYKRNLVSPRMNTRSDRNIVKTMDRLNAEVVSYDSEQSIERLQDDDTIEYVEKGNDTHLSHYKSFEYYILYNFTI